MSHPVLWPTTYFYPIGNSPAVCLTENIPPENAADVLLLGCGDPRNILYTLQADPSTQRPSLDFTCCDMEPGVIARNVLLFTLVYDGHQSDRLWDIFYHIRLDTTSFSLLISQAKRLLEHTTDLAAWEQSSYSRFLRFCSRYTLSQVHRYLGLYAEAEGYSKAKHRQLFSCFTREFEARYGPDDLLFDTARSAGPFSMGVLEMMSKQLYHYWKTGIVSYSTTDISAATFVNPTFIYSEGSASSLVGDRCTLHYAAYPLLGFHLASAFLIIPVGEEITADQLISCAQTEFREWCRTFKDATSSTRKAVTIRLLIGDALAFCQTLSQFRGTSLHTDRLYVSPWKATDMVLDGTDYQATPCAPTSFNIIDTSNVADHVGLLNILISAAPLLSQDPISTLYTEVILKRGGGSASFVQALCADVPTIGLLLGIAPTAAIAQFTSNSKVHHLLGPNLVYRDRISWKASCMADPRTVNGEVAAVTLSFPDSSGFAEILFRIYIEMFPEEDLRRLGSPMERVHYNRATFVMLLGMIKSRVQTDWTVVMNKIFELLHADRKLITGSNYYQELCCQLHLRGVYSVETLGPQSETFAPIDRRSGLFRGWRSVPPVVCLVLVVPRKAIQILEDRSAAGKLGSPILQCEIRGRSFHNLFSCMQVALGSVSLRGTGQDCEVSITEEPAGWSGKSSLIVSVFVPAFNLVYDPEATRISLSLHATQDSRPLTEALGVYLNLFSADITDKHAVHVTLNRPNRSSPVSAATIAPIVLNKQVSVGFNDTQISTLTARWEMAGDELGKGADLREAKVGCSQISLCVVQLVINDAIRNLVYPFPVDGTRAKLRIARKSGWIEVEAPVRQCFPLAPADFSATSVLVRDRCPIAWNIHRINAASLPVVDLKQDGTHSDRLTSTIEAHLSLAMSDREWALAEQKKPSELDLLARVKETLFQLFTGIIGPNRVRVFVFSNPGNGGVDTILYINGIRLDIASDTFVADIGVLPVTKDVLKGSLGSKIKGLYEEPETATASMALTGADEVIAWKHLLAAFTERCRSWTHNSNCKYVISGKIPVSVEVFQNPLCGCGEGVDPGGLSLDPQWKELSPLMTRAAISPLFSIAYLETVDKRLKTWKDQIANTTSSNSDHSKKICAACRKPEPKNSKLLKCSRCKEVDYCGKDCQKKHWKDHKNVCMAK